MSLSDHLIFFEQLGIIQSLKRSAIPQTGSAQQYFEVSLLVLSETHVYTHNFTVFSTYARKCNIFNLIDIGSIMESGENSFFLLFLLCLPQHRASSFFARSVFRQKEAPYACDIIPHLIQKTELLLQIRICNTNKVGS